MFGPPEDIEGKCNARLYLGDDMGDGSCTFTCQLELDHEGLHKEVFNRAYPDEAGECIVTWERDESQPCSSCGRRYSSIDLDSKDSVCYSCRERVKQESWYAFGVIYECPYPEGSWQHRVWVKGYKFMIGWERREKGLEYL